jgi:cell wall-associated NlpC family hydrolase
VGRLGRFLTAGAIVVTALVGSGVSQATAFAAGDSAPAAGAANDASTAGSTAASTAAQQAAQKAAAAAKQLADAKAAAADETRQLAAGQAAVESARSQLDALAAKAQESVERFTAAMATLRKARAKQAIANEHLYVARDRVHHQRQVIDEFIGSAYESGGPLAGLGAVLDSEAPTDLVYRAGLLDRISQSRDNALQALNDLEAANARDARAASDAADVVQATAARAEDARQAAVTALDAQHVIVDKLARSQAALATTLAKQNKVVAAASQDQAAALAKLAAAQAAAAGAAAQAALAAQHDALRRAWVETESITSNLPEASVAQGQQALASAKKALGTPYSWGGGNVGGPTLGYAESKGITAGLHTVGFDCSGLVLWAWSNAGVTLDHYTGYQWLEGKHISLDEVREGDLLFYATDVGDPMTIHHVGLYAGNGQIIDAPHTGAVVRYDPAFTPDLIGAVRP